MRNLLVRGAWLVFEPEEGPGDYELYSHCDAEGDEGFGEREAVRGPDVDGDAWGAPEPEGVEV